MVVFHVREWRHGGFEKKPWWPSRERNRML